MNHSEARSLRNRFEFGASIFPSFEYLTSNQFIPHLKIW